MTRRQVVMAVLGAALVVVVTRGAWIWTHPTLLTDRAWGGQLEFPVKPVGTPVHTAIMVPSTSARGSETITFSKASVRFSTNTAKATGSFSICVPKTQDSVIGGAFGDPAKYCRSIRPIRDGTTMRWVEGFPTKSYVLLTITTHHKGKAIAEEVSVSYSRSWKHAKQHGTSHALVRITVRAG